MDQATQQLNENLSRGHKEYESKIKNVEGILSKLKWKHSSAGGL